MMNELNFKSYFNFLGRNKLYAFINLFGLSISLTFILLIASYTYKQLSTDSFQENADRIYLIGSEGTSGSAYYLQKYMLDRYPEIEKATAIGINSTQAHVSDEYYNVEAMIADSSFFDIFSFKLLSGDKSGALAVKNGVVLSKRFADRIFGSINPIGKTISITMDDDYPLVVTGIMEDIDNSVIPYADLVVAGPSIEHYNPWNNEKMESTGAIYTFLLERKGADLKAKIPDMVNYFNDIFWVYRGGMFKQVILTPLHDIYFTKIKNNEYHILNCGNWSFVMMLFAVAMVLLVFAVINYVNLTMAQTSFRAREMATRRLLGTQRTTVVVKLILEATFLCVVAFGLALCLAETFAPAASVLLAYRFSIVENITVGNAVVCLVVVVGLGILAGLIPAISISRSKPIDIMRGTIHSDGRMGWSKALIVIQNLVTVTFLAFALTMILQVRHLIDEPLGYNTKDIYTLENANNFTSASQLAPFRDELLGSPAIEAVGFGDGYPLEGTNNNTLEYNENLVSFQIVRGDSVYFRIFGFRLKHDNNFASTGDSYRSDWSLNELAFKKLGLSESALEFVVGDSNWSETIPIHGVYYDFHVGHATRENSAVAVVNLGEYPLDSLSISDVPRTTVIKIRGDHAEALRQIESARNAVVKNGMFNQGSFVEDAIRDQYAEQSRLLKIVSVFTIVAILISTLGLFSISSYEIRRKRSEIAVRKVFGSTNGEVLRHTVGEFLKWVLLGGIIACPVIYVAVGGWLDTFTYRIGLSLWIYLSAITFALLIGFVSVLWQSIRAADTDPSESLRG